MSQRTIPHKCPKCGGTTYNCGLLRRRCNNEKCRFFYTGVAMDYYRINDGGFGYDIALIEDGVILHDYEVKN